MPRPINALSSSEIDILAVAEMLADKTGTLSAGEAYWRACERFQGQAINPAVLDAEHESRIEEARRISNLLSGNGEPHA